MTGGFPLPPRYVRAIFGIKALATIAILLGYWFVELLVAPFGRLGIVSFTVLLSLIPTAAIYAIAGETPTWLLRLSLYMDSLALTIGIHLTGGVDNVSTPQLFAAVVSLAGLLLGSRDTLMVAVVSALMYDSMVYAEYAGYLPHLVEYRRPPARQVATVIPLNLFLILFAWLVSFAVGQIRAMYGRLEEQRQEAVLALSHDLKNPLAVIHGYARIMQAASSIEPRSFAPAIERTAQQALDLVSNVLDAAAFDGQPITPRVSPVPIPPLIQDVVDRYRPAAESARVALTADLDSSLPFVEADGQLVARAVGNLISNAVKYAGEGATVTVSAGVSAGQLEIRVRDDGPGIAAAEQPLLFRKYSRTSGARGVEGSGLGLYIVRCIAEAHRGKVGVSSREGAGCTFTFSVPLVARV
jgi:signal transduction histidine kinase